MIQALDADKFTVDPATGTASSVNGGLLWEASVFWHRDENCYGGNQKPAPPTHPPGAGH